MPRLSLTDASGELKPLAPFEVLAVMCHPTDRKARRQMLALVEAQTGVGPAKRPRLSDDEFEHQVEAAAHRGGVIAGGLLLNMIQLHLQHPPATINRAMKMLHYLLPPWEQPTGSGWEKGLIRTSTRRQRILDGFRDFLPVAHLWGARIYSGENGRSDIAPGSNQTLPTFIAYANAFAAMASRVPYRSPGRRLILPPNVVWRFVLREHLVNPPQLVALSLHPEQLAVLRHFGRR